MPACRECLSDPEYQDQKLLCPHLLAQVRRDDFVSSVLDRGKDDEAPSPAPSGKSADHLVWYDG
ncbi:MAG: hypothetical protein UY64_C0011G0002 [Parcubacteria group bacterium GW2011_GWA1_51_12]|nr:MAG: hypothetical protein UY64_C0011G0002 [Parcubacteria group bacterium GW2011_GWA1_51_12]